MILSRFAGVLSVALLSLLTLPTLPASPILYYTPGTLNSGLDRPASTQFTNAVTSTFGSSNVIQVANFETVANDASALFINTRANTSPLSLLEQNSITTFISSGGAVFFIGEHLSWTNWNNSFLNLFGDRYVTWNGVGIANATNALPGQFAPNSTVHLDNPGGITGQPGTARHGTALYTVHANGVGMAMSALYGPTNNAIAFLDSTPLRNDTGTPAFQSSLASWLFTTATAYEDARSNGNQNSVPDSGITALFFTTLLATMTAHRLRRR